MKNKHNNRELLTVFSPAYNRADLLPRGYNALCLQTCHDFKWLIIDDGSIDNTRSLCESWISRDSIKFTENGFEGYSKDASWLHIRYEYKVNGGLHTGYNKAIELMDTEICVCIDSDDYMPNDAVATIVDFWEKKGSKKLAGFIGLDYYDGKDEPIGGYLEEVTDPIHLVELKTKLHHNGDTKIVLRVDLLKEVAPQPTYDGEKNFNPIYMIMLIDQKLPFLTINKNLCFVDYQETGMAANIFRQYVNSPNSFAALRLVEMRQPCISYKRYIIENLHYVSNKFLAGKTNNIFTEGASKFWVAVFLLPGWILSKFILYKAKQL